jgi:hypothetical protein
LITISDANSIPVVSRSSRSTASLRIARQSAMRVGDMRAKEQVQHARQHRIANPPVRPRHRARVDPAAKARTEDELGAVAQGVHNSGTRVRS